MTPTELARLTAFLRARFALPQLHVRPRPRQQDSAEVYIGDEFIGLIYRDDEDEEVSYSFQMAILQIDLP